MKFPISISLPNEPWLEKWARLFRFRCSNSIISEKLRTSKNDITIIDYGCGQDILFYRYLQHEFGQDINRFKYIGIDPLIKSRVRGNTQVIRKRFEDMDTVNVQADIVVLFAVLEHVNTPKELLNTSIKVLKKDGYIIATTPTWKAKLLLEYLAYVMGIISVREIHEHKQYFSKSNLARILDELPWKNTVWSHSYFELGLNNLILIHKKH